MKYARLVDDVVFEVVDQPHGALTWIECPDGTRQGATYDGETFTNPPVPTPDPTAEPEPTPAPTPEPNKVSPVEFKLLFTSAERIAIRSSSDPVVLDFFEIIDDPRLTYVDLGLAATVEGVNYLETQELIGSGRAAEILSS